MKKQHNINTLTFKFTQGKYARRYTERRRRSDEKKIVKGQQKGVLLTLWLDFGYTCSSSLSLIKYVCHMKKKKKHSRSTNTFTDCRHWK